MTEKVGNYQLIVGGITKIIGEETERKAKDYAREAANTDPDVQLLEITEQEGATQIDFRK